MINKSQLIGELVFDVVINYSKKQNDTKLAYFTYLARNRSVKDFKKVADMIWDNIDHKFMDKQIDKLQTIIHEESIKLAKKYNIDIKDIEEITKVANSYLKITPESEFNKVEQKFKERVIKSYSDAKKMSEELDVDTYLAKKLDTYDKEINQAVAYFKKTGGVQRYVEISSYLSMLHNTNLTRAGWNQTISDAEKLGKTTFIIPPHPFSCEHCRSWQGIPLSKEEVINKFGIDDETTGDILHPNCKCTLSILWDASQLRTIQSNVLQYSEEEYQEQYETRQKINSASLQKQRIENDYMIAKSLGNDGLADKYMSRVKKLDKKIVQMVNSLPTKALKKQVEAINR